MAKSKSLNQARLIFVFLLVVNAVLYSQTHRGRSVKSLDLGVRVGHDRRLSKREGVLPLGFEEEIAEDQCAPLSIPIHKQCAHVNEYCPPSDTALSIPYLHQYFCASPQARPFIFGGLVIWLLFIFSTLGISASDFFCPNLASIASLLGLDDNVAGVTLLALGNGSPDVFSTFSAMRSDAGSLAIGELLGAASFIVSCVVGGMCIVRPFHVLRLPFLRDVGFFTTAVSLVLFILWDSEIHAWEAGALVGLYGTYVLVVVIGSWWERRQMKREMWERTVRGEYAEDEAGSVMSSSAMMPPPPIIIEEPYRDDPSPEPVSDTDNLLSVPMTTQRIRAQSTPAAPQASTLAPPSGRMHLDINTNVPSLPYRNARSVTPSPFTTASRHGPYASAYPYTPHTTMATHMPSFSLIGALEFRQVVSSLQQQAAGNQLNVFDVRTPVTPFPGGHYYTRTRFSSSASHPALSTLPSQVRRSHSQMQPYRYSMYEPEQQTTSVSRSRSPFDWFRRRVSSDATAPSTPAVERPRPRRHHSMFVERRAPEMDSATLVDIQEHSPEHTPTPEPNANNTLSVPSLLVPDAQPASTFDIPRIAHIPASPIEQVESSRASTHSVSDTDVESPGAGTPYLTIPRHLGFRDDHLQQREPPTKGEQVLDALQHTLHVLFPTLHNFENKSFLGIVASILAAPAVLALTLTLPVHVQPREDPWGEEKLDDGATSVSDRLVEFEEEGVQRVLTAEEDVRAEMQGHELQYNKFLFAAQLFFGPLFCVSIIFAGMDELFWIRFGTVLVGLLGAVLTVVFSDRGDNPAGVGARCAMGFVVAVVWIMAIADEVVNVLKTFGFIFGLSDALIGLTIFAVGNSLADFVANISVVTFAPMMGFSACFGGPMLNILMGIGGSGSYIIHLNAGEPYILHFSTTLMVSTIGLLSLLWMTLLFVPWNGFYLPRKWGFFLVLCYFVIMSINVVVEVKRHQSTE